MTNGVGQASGTVGPAKGTQVLQTPQKAHFARRVLFQHLMRTGGTSITAMLENFFPAHAVCEYGRSAGHYANRYVRGVRASYVHDHSFVLDLRTHDSFAFTFVREPFSRLVSACAQWASASENELGQSDAPSGTATAELRLLGLDAILDRAFDQPSTVQWLWNHQALSLGLSNAGRMLLKRSDPDNVRLWLDRNRTNILNEAIANLRTCDYVGIFEQFELSVGELFARMGLPEPEAVLQLRLGRPSSAEHDDRLRSKAAPFLGLDEELYAAAVELNARAGRVARGSARSYIARMVRPSDDLSIGSEQPPDGHGWRPAARRAEGVFSRWSGPGRRSTFRLIFAAGRYRLTFWVSGGVSKAAIESLAIEVDGDAVPFRARTADRGRIAIVASISRSAQSMTSVAIVVGETLSGRGIEFERLHIVGHEAAAFSSAVSPDHAEPRQHRMGRTPDAGAPTASLGDGSKAKEDCSDQRADELVVAFSQDGHGTGPRPQRYRRVLFQHLMKTGGTSLVAMLENFFPSNMSREFTATGAGSHARRYVRAGHATFLHDHTYILNMRTADSFAFTILREPFARLLSARRQWTDASDQDASRMAPRAASAVLAMRSLTLESILDAVFETPFLIPWFWNHQAMTLGLWPLARSVFPLNSDLRDVRLPSPNAYRQWLQRNKSNVLKSAVSTLRSLDYVGIQEDFEASTREVFLRIGLPEPELTLRYNPRKSYADEGDDGLRIKALAFLDLDYELYEEGRELHDRRARAVRGPPADYIGRTMRADEDRVFGADDTPGGHGWHHANLRSDGRVSRWTGPGRSSTFSLTMAQGEYRLEAWILGAASQTGVWDPALIINGHRTPLTIEVCDNGCYVAIASFPRGVSGRVEICFQAAEVTGQYGLELAEIRIVGHQAPSYRVDAHAWSATRSDQRRGATDLRLISIGPGQEKIFLAEDLPDGHGWRQVNLKPDGTSSRWTGPGARSVVPLQVSAGSYRVEVLAYGAATARSLMEADLQVDGRPSRFTVTNTDGGHYVAAADFRCESQVMEDLAIVPAETVRGFGIEVASVRISGLRGHAE